jgi:DNA-binding HxlR family transcriptional regulator
MAMSDTSDPYAKPELALEKIGGKWKMPILWRLNTRDVWRYSELKRAFDPISHKMLSRQLRELEADGFIHRELYPVVPPKVEYSLTDKGRKALPAVKALCTFYAEISEEVAKTP